MNSLPGPLGQVLGNLINNAAKHGFEGMDDGEIMVLAKPALAGTVDLSPDQSGG